MNKDLLSRITKAQSEGVIKTISPTTVDEYAERENSWLLTNIIVPWATGKQLWRDENGSHIPCVATYISFNTSAFLSRVSTAIGDLVEGCSINIFGYDIERDAQGQVIFDTTEEDGKEIKTLRIITKDEQGNALDPHELMIFRPQWGIDRTKQTWSRLRDQDMLNLVPNRGVPRKQTKVEKPKAEGEEQAPAPQTREAVAWDLLPHLQPAMEKPILNNKLDLIQAGISEEQATEMAKDMTDETPFCVQMFHFISQIPTASNAPSKKAASQGGAPVALASNQPKGIKVNLPDASFAPPPELKVKEEKAKEAKATKDK